MQLQWLPILTITKDDSGINCTGNCQGLQIHSILSPPYIWMVGSIFSLKQAVSKKNPAHVKLKSETFHFQDWKIERSSFLDKGKGSFCSGNFYGSLEEQLYHYYLKKQQLEFYQGWSG